MSPAAARATPPQRSIKAWWPLVKQAASAWVADYAPSMGAALSYYSVFSLAPLLLIVISVAGLVFGQDAVRGELFGQLSGLVGRTQRRRSRDCWPAYRSRPKVWLRRSSAWCSC